MKFTPLLKESAADPSALSQEYAETGTRVTAVVKPELWARVEPYVEEIRT